MTNDIDASIRDVERTGNIVTTAQWSVASVVMVGSAISAGIAFEHFGEPFFVGFIVGVAVDFALASWLLISRKLRAAGVKTAWGPVLEIATALMTLCLNSGASILKEHYWLAFGHAFLPVVLVLLTVAGGEAQHKLHVLMKQKQAQEKARRDAETEQQRQQQASELRRIKAEKDEQNTRVERERAAQLEQKRLDDQKHQREAAERQEAREADIRRSANILAGALLTSTAMRAVVMATTRAANGSPAHSRQPTTSPRRQPPPAPVASRPPAVRQPTASPVRQPASPATNGSRPAPTPDQAELVTLAKELLAREPNMGRPTLAKQLANATKTKITDYRAKQVLKEIEDERDSQFEADLEKVMNGEVN